MVSVSSAWHTSHHYLRAAGRFTDESETPFSVGLIGAKCKRQQWETGIGHKNGITIRRLARGNL